MRISPFSFVVIPLVLFFGWGFYALHTERINLHNQRDQLNATLLELKEENEEAQENIAYFTKPENLIKEFKAQFNYKEVGEKLIIVVPSPSMVTTTPTNSKR